MENQELHSTEVVAVMDPPLSPGHASQGKDVEAAVSEKYDKQTLTNQSESTKEDENTVDFETDDPDNPLNWALWYKWVIVALVSTMTMIEYVQYLFRGKPVLFSPPSSLLLTVCKV